MVSESMDSQGLDDMVPISDAADPCSDADDDRHEKRPDLEGFGRRSQEESGLYAPNPGTESADLGVHSNP